MLEAHWNSYGPNSAQDSPGVWAKQVPRAGVPHQIRTRADLAAWVAAYDMGIRYVGDHVARLLAILEREGVLGETVVVISADHGE
ncbi:sulfatase-like hydrolase/transferase, partial [Escherichia coli]|nr:sulfatase-like hydrolase/transferase [Escherichia coli]